MGARIDRLNQGRSELVAALEAEDAGVGREVFDRLRRRYRSYVRWNTWERTRLEPFREWLDVSELVLLALEGKYDEAGIAARRRIAEGIANHEPRRRRTCTTGTAAVAPVSAPSPRSPSAWCWLAPTLARTWFSTRTTADPSWRALEGDLVVAEVAARAAAAIAPRVGDEYDPESQARSQSQLAQVLCAAGKYDEAADCAAEAGPVGLIIGADVAVGRGDHEQAAALLDEARAHEDLRDPKQACYSGYIALVDGRRLLALGDQEGASRRRSEAARLARGVGYEALAREAEAALPP